jgi:hypothetical protein
VTIRRLGTGTWFGRLVGLSSVPISAKAAAVAVNSGASKCLKPFAVPDMWDDRDNDINPGNRLWEPAGKGQGKNAGERWQFTTNTDAYRRYGNPTGTGTETGYGSSFRNQSQADEVYGSNAAKVPKYFDDYGRPLNLKITNPQQTPASSFFMPWVLPNSGRGAKDYQENIVKCNTSEIKLDQDYDLDSSLVDTTDFNKPGNMVGPTNKGVDSLVSLDPEACYAEFLDTNPAHTGGPYMAGEVRKTDGQGKCTKAYPDWESSPRVVLLTLFDPAQMGNGRTKLRFNNIALFFVEGQDTPKSPVVGRFLYFAKGTGPAGPASGSLIKKLQLVE